MFVSLKVMNELIEPHLHELPSSFADRLGLHYTSFVTQEHKKSQGQFFTPHQVASFISKKILINQFKIKILDPGCGIGILSCALVEQLLISPSNIKEIEIDAFETDNEIIPLARICFDYLRIWVSKKKIDLKHKIIVNDFILANSKILNNRSETEEGLYDLVITNPPYFKVRKDDERAIASKSIIRNQTNIYSIFLMISAKLLKDNGKLAFITPRSFASGSYFKLFREKFFSIIALDFIHLFESRTEAFQRDKVLQESIIVCGSKRKYSLNQLQISFENAHQEKTIISTSQGLRDLEQSNINTYTSSDLININSNSNILFIPTSSKVYDVIKLFKTWENKFTSLGCDISTGPVVAFRCAREIQSIKGEKVLPMLWLHNVSKMNTAWPVDKAGKGQFIKFTKKALPVLIPNKNYILVRRFSSKDDKHRLIASPYFSSHFSEFNYIGVENHLNYIYKFLGELNEIEILGICGFLNSELFDIYFRSFNGNTNVSVTELQQIPFPNISIIKKLGELIKAKSLKKITQKFIDSKINSLLNLNI